MPNVLPPPPSGEVALDAWLQQVYRELNLPTPVVQQGATTAAGDNTQTVIVYRVSSDQANAPTFLTGTVTYDFTDGSIETNGNLNGWVALPPEIPNGDYLWASQVTISSRERYGRISIDQWSTPVVIASNVGAGVSVVIDALTNTAGNTANWETFANTRQTSPDFKNNTGQVKGLRVTIYEGGEPVPDSVYSGSITFTWRKNGVNFTPNATQVNNVTGTDRRVLLINQDDVAEGNMNEIFTCRVVY